MNQPLLPKKSSSGQKKKFHFHDKKAGTTVVYTTNKENEKTSLKTSHFGSLATFRNISSVTKKSTHSGSSTTRANISSFFKPVNLQHATSENEAVKKGKPPVPVTTGFISASFSPSLSKNEIPVGKATILRNKESNVGDILESLNEDGDQQNLVKNPLASAGHVTKRSNSRFSDVEKMKTPSASKRYFTDVDTGSVSDSEFLPQSNGFKRLKKACDDDIDEEPDNVVNGYQESYFNGDDEFDDIQHELSEAELDLNIPSPPPPEYLSPNNSPARFTDFEDNNEVQPPDPIPQISQPRVSASLEVSTEVLQEKLNKTCEDYINVLEEMADTLKTFDDELLQNILGAEKHEVFKKRRIERNRLRAEKKRLSIKLKAKQSVQAPSQRSTSTNPGSLAENEHFDSAGAARVGTSSRHSSDSGVLPPCGESFFEKSPPVPERNTSLQPFITTSHSGCTTPTWQSNITKLQNQSKPEMIDLSCDEEPPSGNFLSTPCGSSTPANVLPTRIGPVKIGARVTPGTSGGLNTPTSGACDRSVSSAGKSTPAGSNGKAPVKKIGNSLPDDGYRSEFKRTDYDFSRDMLKALRQTFGLKCFRSNQHEAITAVLLKRDCFILMPTGGGKSLCYQLPAIISPGVTIVVSPLKSLIQDQVSKLVSNHIPAFQLTGETTEKTMNSIYRDLSFMEPQTKLLYVTPEKLSASEKLLSTLQGLYNREKLSRFVIDEAHCVSQWGHDFRPDYKKLSALKNKFSGVPMMALTATATPRVRQDVVTQLGMRNPMWFSQSFNRPNLQFLLRPKKLVMKEIIDTIKRSHPNHSGIIYCLSRLECDKLADDLYKAGIEAIAYHAGLADARRAKVQEDWIRDRCKVICATIAFGMGIDKADVRFVFHHSLPKSLEGYFQECGRAGRDGQNAVCILFYSYGDVHRLKRIILADKSQPRQSTDVHMNNLYRVVQYCENQSECRRAQLLEYFGETGFDKADCSRNRATICDNCSSASEMIVLDILKEAKIVVESVNTLVHRGNSNWRRPMVQLTLNHLVDVFKGSKNAKVEKEGLDRCAMYGLALKNNFNRNDAERLFRMLLMQDILAEDLTVGAHSQVICYAKLGPKAMDFLNDRVKLPRFFARNPISKRRPDAKGESSTMNDVNNECYLQLVSCCKSLAESRRIKPEHIFADSTLRQMSSKLPMTRDEMLDIEGVTEYKMDNFGQQFLELTITYGGALFASDADMISEVDSMRVENNGSNMERDFESPYWATAANFSGNKTKKKSKYKKKKSYQSKKGWSKKQSTSKKKNTSAPPPSNTNSHMNNPLVKSYQDFSKGRKLGPTRQCGFLSLAPRK